MDFKRYKDTISKKEQKIKEKNTLSEKEKQEILLILNKTEDIIDDINLNEIKNENLKQNFLQYFLILDKNLNLLLDNNKQNDNLPELKQSFNNFSNSFSKYTQKYSGNIYKLQGYALGTIDGVKKAGEFVYEDIKELIEFLTSWENISKLPLLIGNIINNFDKILESFGEETKKKLNNLKIEFQSLNQLHNDYKISDKLYNYKNTSIGINIVLIIAYEFIPISKIKTLKNIEELDSIIKEGIEKGAKKVKLTKNMDKTIIYKKLSDNFPLLGVNRLKEGDVVYNISFGGIKKINDTYGQEITDEILNLIKKEIKNEINNGNRTIRDNYKNLTFTLNDKDIETILGKSKKEFIKNILGKKKDYLQNKIHGDYNKFEQDILSEFSIGIGKAEVKFSYDKDKIQAFYEAEISSRHKQSDIIKGIEYDKKEIEIMAQKTIQLEKEIISKFEGKTYKDDMQIIIENNEGNKIINTDLIRKVRKGKDIGDNKELKELVSSYIKNLNDGFDFIAPYINLKKDMKFIQKIEKEIQKGKLDINHLIKDYKGTLSKGVLEKFIENKSGSLYFIDIKDMGIMNLADFHKLAKKIVKEGVDNVDLTSSGKSVTESFILFVKNIRKNNPDLKIALGGDEIYIYDKKTINISDHISYNLEKEGLKGRITQYHGEIKKNTIEILDKNTAIIKKVEEKLEKTFSKSWKNIPNVELTNSINIKNPSLVDINIDISKIAKLKKNENIIIGEVEGKKIRAILKNDNLLQLTILDK